jgi:hypothetical protein
MVYFTISSVLEVLFMLRDWTPHSDYQDKLRLKMLLYCETKRNRLVALDKKRMLEDYAIEEYDARSAMMRTSLAALAVINIHLDAWIKHTNISFVGLLEQQAA